MKPNLESCIRRARIGYLPSKLPYVIKTYEAPKKESLRVRPRGVRRVVYLDKIVLQIWRSGDDNV